MSLLAGAPDSMSWMNYSWKYDEMHDPGSFYKSFTYSFSPIELVTLRHSPGQVFHCTWFRFRIDYSTLSFIIRVHYPLSIIHYLRISGEFATLKLWIQLLALVTL